MDERDERDDDDRRLEYERDELRRLSLELDDEREDEREEPKQQSLNDEKRI